MEGKTRQCRHGRVHHTPIDEDSVILPEQQWQCPQLLQKRATFVAAEHDTNSSDKQPTTNALLNLIPLMPLLRTCPVAHAIPVQVWLQRA